MHGTRAAHGNAYADRTMHGTRTRIRTCASVHSRILAHTHTHVHTRTSSCIAKRVKLLTCVDFQWRASSAAQCLATASIPTATLTAALSATLTAALSAALTTALAATAIAAAALAAALVAALAAQHTLEFGLDLLESGPAHVG